MKEMEGTKGRREEGREDVVEGYRKTGGKMGCELRKEGDGKDKEREKEGMGRRENVKKGDFFFSYWKIGRNVKVIMR